MTTSRSFNIGTIEEVRAIGAGLVSAGVRTVESPNPYWNRFGQTFLYPDGYRIVIAHSSPEGALREQTAGYDEALNVEIDWHVGPRVELRAAVRVRRGFPQPARPVPGPGQGPGRRSRVNGAGSPATRADDPVRRDRTQEHGGRAGAARHRSGPRTRRLCRSQVSAQCWSRMVVVATAAADTGNLGFYQRVGFRLISVERDAFTAATGYPDPIAIDDIPLLDRVWLS
jgi:hypothetical protein